MRVHFERTGGMAGMRLAATIDGEALAPDERARLEELVTAVEFFGLPEHLAAPSSGADRFQYRVTVERGDQRHTVLIAEGAAPPALRPLLEWLTRAMRGRRGS
jgi:Emfourin